MGSSHFLGYGPLLRAAYGAQNCQGSFEERGRSFTVRPRLTIAVYAMRHEKSKAS
jgi:hypothetical protein